MFRHFMRSFSGRVFTVKKCGCSSPARACGYCKFRLHIYFVNCNWVATLWQQHSTHLHTNSTQNDKNKHYIEQYKNIWKSEGRAPSLRVIPWHLHFNRGKPRKNLSQCSRRVPAGTMKIHNRTIRIYRHNNKNTKITVLNMNTTVYALIKNRT
jgi:hypothetical protein